ncbi:MAG: DUF2339 domain-containing protein [Lachnospiraceae bacterium]|nr:DUF2339 domain-containing protein [Lachnospiraceae bacterium]
MDNYQEEMLQNLIKRVYHLEQEVIKLGGQPYKKEEQTAKVVQMGQPGAAVKTETVKQEGVVPNVETVKKENVQAAAASVNKTKKPTPIKKNSGVENKIGKNGMAILASVLIFFSLILFAGIAFSYLTDVAKVVIMFAISIAIAAFGIIKMPKSDSEKNLRFKVFYTTLAACGVGAIYITDLVAYFGFKCMPLVVFIISIVIWIAVTMVLSYKFSAIFAYICNIGLVIATVLTAVQFNSSIVAFILYTVCLAALYMMIRNKNYNKDCIFFIQYPVVFIILSFAVETGLISYIIFTVLLSLVFIAVNTAYKIDNSTMATNIVTVVLNIFAIMRIAIGSEGDVMKCVAILILVAIMIMYSIKYYTDIKALFYVVFGITYFASALILMTTAIYDSIFLIPFILLLFVGFMKKDIVIRLGGYLAFIVSYLMHMDNYESWFVFAGYFIVLLIAIAAVYFVNYLIADKYIITILLCLTILDVIGRFELDVCIGFVVFGILAFIMNTKIYHNDPITGKKELSSQIIGYVFNAIVLFAGLVYSFDSYLTKELYQVIIVMLVTLALCCINTVNLFDTVVPEVVVGFYICIKFSLWIMAALHRLDAASYVVSIVGIVIAIVCIVIGFNIKKKSFRLYGLIVSMVSVIKLILFDISYDSNILRPIGFFVAGVLCFAISFIYSKLEKSMSAEE